MKVHQSTGDLKPPPLGGLFLGWGLNPLPKNFALQSQLSTVNCQLSTELWQAGDRELKLWRYCMGQAESVCWQSFPLVPQQLGGRKKTATVDRTNSIYHAYTQEMPSAELVVNGELFMYNSVFQNLFDNLFLRLS
ncbi:hypothetical protein QUB60_18805 [Microcoleus sp. A2-C5]